MVTDVGYDRYFQQIFGQRNQDMQTFVEMQTLFFTHLDYMLARLHTRLISLPDNFHIQCNPWVCGLLCYRFAYRAAAGHFGASLARVLDLEAQQRQEQETRSGGTAGESQSSKTGSSGTEPWETGSSGTEHSRTGNSGTEGTRARGTESGGVSGMD